MRGVREFLSIDVDPIPPNGESQDGKKIFAFPISDSDFEIAFLGAAATAAVDLKNLTFFYPCNI